MKSLDGISSNRSLTSNYIHGDGEHDSCYHYSINYGDDSVYLPPVSVSSSSSAADYEPPFIDLTNEDDPADTDIGSTIINPTTSSDHDGMKTTTTHGNNKRSSQQANRTTTTPNNNRSKQRRRTSSSIVPNTASSMKSNNSSYTTDDDNNDTCITRLFDPALKVIIMTAADAKSNFTLFEDIQPSFVILYDAGKCISTFASRIYNDYTTQNIQY